MPVITLKYNIAEEGLETLDGCASNQLISELKDATKQAFNKIEVSFEYDENFGTLNLIAVNNRMLEGY